MGVPTIVGSAGVEKVLNIQLRGEEQRKLLESARTLRGVLDTFCLPK